MSFHKATKKDEEELKEYQTTKTVQQSEPGKVNVDALREEIEGKIDKDGKKKGGRDISFAMFAGGDEQFRKKVLKGDYAELKLKYGWLYDQPIKADV